MQNAVDGVATSPHPDNKIAVHLVGMDGHSVTAVNDWPEPIANHLGKDTLIGSSSGTVHAEVAAILRTRRTRKAVIFITDPFCPNCAKNMADAGVGAIYIDHKGFTKDFAQRRGNDFATMSMRISQKAGMAVSVINRKDRTINPIHIPPAGYEAFEARPVEFRPNNLGPFVREVERRHFAMCQAVDGHGSLFYVRAFTAPAIGYDYRHQDDLLALTQGEGKYSYQQEPANRLVFNLRRYGLMMAPDSLVTSRVPTSRELVNLVGAGIETLMILNPHESRDPEGLKAMQQLIAANIITLRK